MVEIGQAVVGRFGKRCSNRLVMGAVKPTSCAVARALRMSLSCTDTAPRLAKSRSIMR